MSARDPLPVTILWQCLKCGYTVWTVVRPRCEFAAHGGMEPVEV